MALTTKRQQLKQQSVCSQPICCVSFSVTCLPRASVLPSPPERWPLSLPAEHGPFLLYIPRVTRAHSNTCFGSQPQQIPPSQTCTGWLQRFAAAQARVCLISPHGGYGCCRRTAAPRTLGGVLIFWQHERRVQHVCALDTAAPARLLCVCDWPPCLASNEGSGSLIARPS